MINQSSDVALSVEAEFPVVAVGVPEVAIAIPTYKRADRLARLLDSLEPSLAWRRTHVIVADNACEDATRAIVERFAARWPGTSYLAVAKRGISANRNALIQAFLAEDPQTAWLAMVDDDLAVSPDWLEHLVATAWRFDADVVGAPYFLDRTSKSFVVNNSIFVKRRREPTGPCAPVLASGNVLISRRLLTLPEAPRFDDAFGLSGGEDYDFFRRAERAGARFVWCDEAVAVEEVDVDRLTRRAVFHRYFSSGLYMAIVDRSLDGAAAGWRASALHALRAVGIVAQGAARRDPARALHGVLRFLIASGGLAGLAGLRLYRYR